MTPGTVLASSRKAAGLSVADIAAQLRLSPRQVEALEADRYEALPGAVFVRGFIRNYARVLKLDPTPLLQALEPTLGEEAPLRVRATSGTLPLAARRDHVKPLLILFCAILIALLAAGGYELWSRQTEQNRAVVASAPGSQVAQSTAVPLEPVQQQAPPSAAPSEGNVEPAQQAPSASETPAAVAPASEWVPHNAGSTRMGRLRVHFAAESWLEVRDREGAVIFLGTGPAGTERTLEAASPMTVVIGNASGVRITYNGEPLDLSPHAARNIARLTLE